MTLKSILSGLCSASVLFLIPVFEGIVNAALTAL